MWARLSMKTKLTALVVCIVSVATWTLGKFVIQTLLDLLNQVQGRRVMTVAAALGEVVEQSWVASWTVERVNEPEYAQLVARITRLVETNQIARVHMVRFLDEGKIMNILSLPVDETRDYSPPGKIMEVQSVDVYTEKTSGYGGVELARKGKFMGGWVPISFDGKPVGLIVVAINIDDTQTAVDTLQFAIATTLIAFTLLAGLTAYKFSSAFEKSAVTDGLMGIYNHKFFKQRLDQEIAKSRRYGQQTALVLLDIDFFKRVNDTYGHAVGDVVLKNLAKWVLESSRSTDVVARYGGEEIAVILPHTGLAGAQEFAERLRQKVSNQVILEPEENAEFRITISVGVAQWEKGMEGLDLIKHADAALYHSKNTGRNRVSIYHEDLLLHVTI